MVKLMAHSTLVLRITRPQFTLANLILRVRSRVSVEACGKRIVNVTATYLRANLSMVNVMVMAGIFSRMATITSVSSKKIITKAKESL